MAAVDSFRPGAERTQRDWQDAEREHEEDTKYGTDLRKQDAMSRRIAADLASLSAYKQ